MAEPAKQIDPVFEEGEDIRIRLLGVAVRLFRSKGCIDADTILPGTAKSARGLVQDAFVKLLKSGKWHPGSGGPDIFPLAKVTLDNLFKDLLRKSEYKTYASIDAEEADQILEFIDLRAVSPFKAIAAKDTYEWVRRQMGSDKKAIAFVDAVQNGATTRAEIAEDLGVDPEEVTKIQKRIQYKLHKMEQMMWELKDQR
jgi:DNA-directed RNA polymerase specialized sigma24 family protein